MVFDDELLVCVVVWCDDDFDFVIWYFGVDVGVMVIVSYNFL